MADPVGRHRNRIMDPPEPPDTRRGGGRDRGAAAGTGYALIFAAAPMDRVEIIYAVMVLSLAAAGRSWRFAAVSSFSFSCSRR
jgi:hypothetical protein